MAKPRPAAAARPHTDAAHAAFETRDAIDQLEDVRLAYVATEILASPCTAGLEAKSLDIDREQLGALLRILNCSFRDGLRDARLAADTAVQLH